MSWMEYQFDKTWGKYNNKNDADKLMFSKIENDKESLCHYLQQFGMGLKCIEQDLKWLTLIRTIYLVGKGKQKRKRKKKILETK